MRLSDIVGWRGLLAEEPPKPRRFALFVHLVMLASLTFLQLGFVPLGFTVPHIGSMLPAIGPVVATSLLLGMRPGALMGLVASLLLVSHSFFQPCDIAEYLCVTPFGTVGLLLAGALSGPLLQASLQHAPAERKRSRAFLGPCALSSALVTAFFVGGAALLPNTSYLAHAGSLWAYIHNLTGSIAIQLLANGAVALAFALGADAIARAYTCERSTMSVRLHFRLQLLGMVSLALLVGAASAFIRLTQYCLLHAYNEMSAATTELADNAAVILAAHADVEDAREALEAIVGAYSLGAHGTVVLYGPNDLVISNRYVGSDEDVTVTETVFTMAGARNMGMVFFGEDEDDKLRLGFVHSAQAGAATVTLIRPASEVFRDRFFALSSIATTTVILLALVYVYAARLLGNLVGDPIDQTNDRLARITTGDLNAVADARGSSEFSSLSDGINATVASLRDYAEEASRRIEEDLATAQSIQQGALPRQLPLPSEAKPFDIYASMQPAKDVGGDFYDFFLVDDHTLGFVIADVSGKGIPAALFMMEAKNEISSRMQSIANLAEAMDAANATLCVGNDEAMFVTVWAATLDWETGELSYVNAGHNQPLLRHEGIWRWMPENGGPIMGIGDFFSYECHTIQLDRGDELLLYTDGVTEALNRRGILYGDERILNFLQAHADLRPSELDEAVRTEVARWADGAEQSDDITTLILEFGR